MSLLWLAPEIQEDVLFLEAIDGREPVSGQALEKIARIADWGVKVGWPRAITFGAPAAITLSAP